MNRDLLEHRNAADTLLGTAPADLIEPFEAPPSTLDEARKRAEQIRAGLVSYVETRAAIAEAWARRDWRTLGYDNWEAYLGGEFGEELRRLAGDERREAVTELRQQGMSTRAIGATLGASEATVRRDLAAAPGDTPATVTGSDGKTYPARKAAAEKPERPCGAKKPHPAHEGDYRCPGVPDNAVVTQMSQTEFDAAAQRELERLQLTYEQLEDMARLDNFTSLDAKKLWLAIRRPAPTPDVQAQPGEGGESGVIPSSAVETPHSGQPGGPGPEDSPAGAAGDDPQPSSSTAPAHLPGPDPAPASIGHGPAAPPAATPSAEGFNPPGPSADGDSLWSVTDVAADGTLLAGLDPGAEVYDYGTIRVAGLRFPLSVRAGRLVEDDAPMAFLGAGDEQPLALSMLQVQLLIRKLSAAHKQMEQMAAADPVVWVARQRRGISFHALLTSVEGSTRCERSTRTGTTLLRSQAIAKYQAQPCDKCWPSPTGE